MSRSDAIALLKADHRSVEALLEELIQTTDRAVKKRQKLIAAIERELRIHTHIEETIFYPAFRDAVIAEHDRKLYFQAIEEHHVVKLIFPDIARAGSSSEPFAAKVTVLREIIRHHTREEEREMFPEARKVLGRKRLEELGVEMTGEKNAMRRGRG